MTGTIALQGGGPFTANDDLDRQLLADVGATKIVMLPTADAFEHPERLVASAMTWGERLDIEVEALMVLNRSDALDKGAAKVVRSATAVFLVGDQPLHLRSVLKDTPTWQAIAPSRAAPPLFEQVYTHRLAQTRRCGKILRDFLP